MTFEKNIGPRERIARLSVGALAFSLLLLTSSRVAQGVLGVVGIAGLTTGATRYCPLNQALGINNYPPRQTSLEQQTSHALQ